MTSNAAVVAIFLSPVALMLVVAGFIAVAEGDVEWWILGFMTAIGAGTSALIFGLTRLGMGLVYHDHERRFAMFVAALGGTVHRSLLGERQLRVPHPRGRVELDYRHVGGGSGRAGERFTRVALVCGAGELPAVRLILAEGTGAPTPPAAAQTEVAALRAAFGKPTRVHLEGRRREPAVEVWVQGWVADPEVARRTVELARPHLEALASAPWSA